jgi:hypothetical protein
MEIYSVSAVLLGPPGALKMPKPLPGERMAEVAIRSDPRGWKTFVDTLCSTRGLTAATRSQLLGGRVPDVLPPEAQADLLRFVNRCLPTPFRTLEGLARHRDALRTKSNKGHVLVDILWLRELPPKDHAEGQRKAEEARAGAEKLGVTVVPVPHGASSLAPTGSRLTAEEMKVWGIEPPPPTLDLTEVMRQARGQFLWIVPGGTRLPEDLERRLQGALSVIGGDSKAVLYTDNVASFVVQMSPLYDLVNRRIPVAADPAWLGRILRKAGWDAYAEENADEPLCELEQEFGGWTRRDGGKKSAPRTLSPGRALAVNLIGWAILLAVAWGIYRLLF